MFFSLCLCVAVAVSKQNVPTTCNQAHKNHNRGIQVILAMRVCVEAFRFNRLLKRGNG